MGLLGHEMRKIWNPVVCTAILVLGILYYYLFCSFYVSHFNNGPYEQAQFDLAVDWAENYGTTIEPEEFAGLENQREQYRDAISQDLRSDEFFASAGITDWDGFADWSSSLESEDTQRPEARQALRRVLMNKNYNAVLYLNSFIECYQNAEQRFALHALDKKEDKSDIFLNDAKERYEQIRVSSARYGYLPSGMMWSTLQYFKHLTVWSILSVFLLISPVLVRDRLHRMRETLWVSRKGRRLFHLQLTAASLSAAMLTMLNITAYAVPFLMQNTLIFKDFSLFSVYSFTFPWTDWTYGTYLLVLCGMVFLMSLAACGLAVFLSQFSGQYVSMLLKALPVYVCLRYLCAEILMEVPFFRYYRPLVSLATPPCYEWCVIAVLSVVSILLQTISCLRIQRLNI